MLLTPFIEGRRFESGYVSIGAESELVAAQDSALVTLIAGRH